MFGISEYRVEHFGSVRANHSEALNFHLQMHLETFDKLFEANGGTLGSPSHQFEKELFARSACGSLIASQSGKTGDITALETIGTHDSKSLNVSFDIKTETKHKTPASTTISANQIFLLSSTPD